MMTTKEVDFKIVDLILATGTLPKESRNNPVFHDCIHELSALPIYRLSSEPSYLQDCHKRIVEENHKLAYDNYSTFIQTAECTKSIFKDFEDVEKKNELLSARIPDFVDSCNSFVDRFRKSISVASMNSVTLKNHNQILEILEIPQLLEACIRNSYIDEALEVIAHTRRLERRHQNIDIVKDVARESRLAAQKLLDQLFQQLGGALQLPACLKIVGYLRRMDCLPDALLRLKFLQCRDNYLTHLLHSVPTNDPFFHATKYMEMTRVNLFDMATQYRAVFNDDDVYVGPADVDGACQPHQQQQGTLFASWLVMRVRVFLASLAEDLSSIVQGSIDYSRCGGDLVLAHAHSKAGSSSQSVGSKLQSLLGQAMYFGLSLSRIGSDFRALLIPVFYEAVMKYVELRLDEIPIAFAACISSYKWTVNLDAEQRYSLEIAMGVTDQLLATRGQNEEIGAPGSLMNHPLLAVLANQLVSVLEDIRLCCPRALRQRIWQAFAAALDRVAMTLLKHYQENLQGHQHGCPTDNMVAAAVLPSNSSTGKHEQLRLFESMLGALLCQLVPHLNLCLAALFLPADNIPGDGRDHDVVPHSNGRHGRLHHHRHDQSVVAIDVAKLATALRAALPEAFFECSTRPDGDDDGDHGDVVVNSDVHDDEDNEAGRDGNSDEATNGDEQLLAISTAVAMGDPESNITDDHHHGDGTAASDAHHHGDGTAASDDHHHGDGTAASDDHHHGDGTAASDDDDRDQDDNAVAIGDDDDCGQEGVADFSDSVAIGNDDHESVTGPVVTGVDDVNAASQ